MILSAQSSTSSNDGCGDGISAVKTGDSDRRTGGGIGGVGAFRGIERMQTGSGERNLVTFAC